MEGQCCIPHPDELLRSSIILHRKTDWIEPGWDFEAEQMFCVTLTIQGVNSKALSHIYVNKL